MAPPKEDAGTQGDGVGDPQHQSQGHATAPLFLKCDKLFQAAFGVANFEELRVDHVVNDRPVRDLQGKEFSGDIIINADSFNGEKVLAYHFLFRRLRCRITVHFHEFRQKDPLSTLRVFRIIESLVDRPVCRIVCSIGNRGFTKSDNS